ncbi:hypothetical protein BDV19DRAFT_372525 [Aspergillus venezuelensis]
MQTSGALSIRITVPSGAFNRGLTSELYGAPTSLSFAPGVSSLFFFYFCSSLLTPTYFRRNGGYWPP